MNYNQADDAPESSPSAAAAARTGSAMEKIELIVRINQTHASPK